VGRMCPGDAPRAGYVALPAPAPVLNQTSQSLSFLLAGSILGFLAFLLPILLGRTLETGNITLNIDGMPFESGRSYYPETVSEMVQDQDSPVGKTFFGFVLAGSICLLISQYPWNLRNVNVGAEVWQMGAFRGIFLNLRTLLPPVGMIIVSCIRVVPKMQRTLGDRITCNVHTAGAVTAIGGYCVFESLTLFRYQRRAQFTGCERTVRIFLASFCAFAVLLFQIGGILTSTVNFGSGDVWLKKMHG